MQEKTQKPNFFFKNVELTMEGFKFTEFEEFEVNDHMPTTIKRLMNFNCGIHMNDFFIVIVGLNRRLVTIIYRKNLKYVKTEDEIPSTHPPPCFLDASCFERSIEGKCYRCLKLLEVESVRVTFDSHVQKVLFNGDQIFLMFKTFIFIYTPLATCTLEISPMDIAVNFYLYVLTEDRILIYNEALYKTIDIDKKCKFIVPTPAHVFVMRGPFIYKITDNGAEVYFDTIQHIRDVVFDDQFMYIATNFSVMRIGLYEPSSESIHIKIPSPKLKLCDDYIILHDSNNGIGFIDKKDFQRFCFRLLNWDLIGMTAYKNEVVYLGSEELRIFRFVESYRNLEPEDPKKRCPANEPVKLRKPSDIANLINSKSVPYPHDYYGMTFNSAKCKAFEDLKLFRSDHQKELDEDLKRLLHESEMCPESIEDASEGMRRATNTLPLSGPCDLAKPQDIEKLYSDGKALNESECTRKILGINAFLRKKKIDILEDTTSEESSGGLFFDDSEYLESKNLRKDPLLEHISRKRKLRCLLLHEKTNQRMVSSFARSLSRHTINNPYTYSSPLDAFDRDYARLIRFSRKYRTYQKTSFFCRNHFSFFKRRFCPRNEEERTPRYHIYNLIQEEFKKIVGYKSNRPTKPEKRVDFSRRANSGF